MNNRKAAGKLVIAQKEEGNKKKRTDLNFFERKGFLVMNCGLEQWEGSISAPLTFADSDFHKTTEDVNENRLSLCASFKEIVCVSHYMK